MSFANFVCGEVGRIDDRRRWNAVFARFLSDQILVEAGCRHRQEARGDGQEPSASGRKAMDDGAVE